MLTLYGRGTPDSVQKALRALGETGRAFDNANTPDMANAAPIPRTRADRASTGGDDAPRFCEARVVNLQALIREEKPD